MAIRSRVVTQGMNTCNLEDEQQENAFALRLAIALQKDSRASDIWFFLMADAVVAALPAQATPQGYYSVERMLKSVMAKGGLRGTCCEARGLSSMAALAAWTAESDKILVF